MPGLRTQLEARLRGRVCLAGVGETTAGDDALGVALAEALAPLHSETVIVHHAGNRPETTLAVVEEQRIDSVLFLDAVDFGAAPGSVTLLDAPEIISRYPQVSTHKLSIGLLARLLSANDRTRVALLGVQPGSLRLGFPLTPAVADSVDALAGLLRQLLAAPGRGQGHPAPMDHHVHLLLSQPCPAPCI